MFHHLRLIIVVAILATVGFVVLPAQASLFVSTGHTGAQVQCDINHTRFWTYTVTADVFGVDGALFDMKRGPNTSADITFAIIQGTFSDFGTATPIFEKTLTPSAFTQSYEPVMFQNTATNLYAGTTYTGVLYSNAADPQDLAYFIKEGLLYFVNENGDRVTPPGGGSIVPGDTNIPEPATLALLALAGAVIIPARRK